MNTNLPGLKVLAALALVAMTGTAMAGSVELVTNGSFEQTVLTGKGNFYNNDNHTSNVTGWTALKSSLTFLDFPGTATSSTGGLAVYPGFPSTSSDGGNFVEADGDPTYSAAITQQIAGLVIGAQYTLTFDQAAGQQNHYTGPTTEQWKVSLGGDTQYSTLFSLAQGATGLWQAQSMTFTANAVMETLSFLAVGTPGGAPPISFLDGVSLTAVPEPTSLALLGVGLLGFGVLRLRRRPSATTVA